METGAISTALPAIQCVIWRISLLAAKKGRQWRAFHAKAFSGETDFLPTRLKSAGILRPSHKIFPFLEELSQRSVRSHWVQAR